MRGGLPASIGRRNNDPYKVLGCGGGASFNAAALDLAVASDGARHGSVFAKQGFADECIKDVSSCALRFHRPAAAAEQIAAEYGIGYKRIRALAQAGIIPKVPHMGRRILIHRDNVEAFVRGEA